jgi:carbonic anhydrase
LSITDELLKKAHNRVPMVPDVMPHGARIAVLACMDSRLDVYRVLDLELGDAHVIRNAGGAATEDMIRSLAISQRLLGTTEIALIHHTDCGMMTFTDDGFRAKVAADTGIRPPWSAETFTNLEIDIKQSIARLKASPFLPHTDKIRGFIYSVEKDQLDEVF